MWTYRTHPQGPQEAKSFMLAGVSIPLRRGFRKSFSCPATFHQALDEDPDNQRHCLLPHLTAATHHTGRGTGLLSASWTFPLKAAILVSPFIFVAEFKSVNSRSLVEHSKKNLNINKTTTFAIQTQAVDFVWDTQLC